MLDLWSAVDQIKVMPTWAARWPRIQSMAIAKSAGASTHPCLTPDVVWKSPNGWHKNAISLFVTVKPINFSRKKSATKFLCVKTSSGKVVARICLCNRSTPENICICICGPRSLSGGALLNIQRVRCRSKTTVRFTSVSKSTFDSLWPY